MIYTDVDTAVWPAAEWSVRAQLDYLASPGGRPPGIPPILGGNLSPQTPSALLGGTSPQARRRPSGPDCAGARRSG